MKKTNLGIDKIYTINLPERKDRKEKFIERFSTLDFSFVEAIRGEDIKIPKLIKKGIVSKQFLDPGGSINKWIVACALSHIKVWEEFKSSKKNTCLVFEDDVVISRDINKNITETITEENKVIARPPQYWNELFYQIQDLDWDIIFLGKKERYVDGTSVNKLQPQESPLFCIPFWSSGLWGAHSYMINKKSVTKLLKKYKPIEYSVDVFLDLCNNSNLRDMKVFALKESLFRQETDIYIHDKNDWIAKLDSDTLHNRDGLKKFTTVKVDETVDSIEFINYPSSSEYTGEMRWPPLIRAKFRL